MIPFIFSALCIQAVGKAAMDMVNEVRRQLSDVEISSGNKEPDHKACIRIST